MIASKKTDWEQTDLYKEMVEETNRQVEYYRRRAKRAESDLAGMKHEAEVIYKDNVALKKDCRISEPSAPKRVDSQKIKNENIKLAALVEAKEETIQFLRSILSGGRTEPVHIPKRGPKAKIPEEQKIRILKMHRNGATVRMIAQAEEVSVGSVSRIIKEDTENVKR